MQQYPIKIKDNQKRTSHVTKTQGINITPTAPKLIGHLGIHHTKKLDTTTNRHETIKGTGTRRLKNLLPISREKQKRIFPSFFAVPDPRKLFL